MPIQYPCSICNRNIRMNDIFCEHCNHWIHRQCANLTSEQFNKYSSTEEDWCLNKLFPFGDLTDEELCFNMSGVDDNLIELYEQCAQLKYVPFNYSDKNDYTINGSIDPDNNLHNRVNVDSLYYTDDEFNTKVVPKSEGLSNFSIIHFNTRSMAANFNKLKACIAQLDYKFDVIAIIETWMNDNESEEFQLENYNAYYISRHHRTGGGVALYINKALKHKPLPNFSKCIDSCAEVTCAEIITSNGKNIIVAPIYRAPNTDLTLLNEHIEYMFHNCNDKTMYLCGDFNVDLLQCENHAVTSNFIDQIYSYGLHPLITRPTRITKQSATLIDNIFTTELEKYTVSGLIINDLSDHLPVFQICDYVDNIHQQENQCFETRPINEEKLQSFISILVNMKWEVILNNEDVNFTYTKLIEIFTNTYESSFSVRKLSRKTKRQHKPWMTPGLKNACKKKHVLYKRFLKARNDAAEVRYKKI